MKTCRLALVAAAAFALTAIAGAARAQQSPTAPNPQSAALPDVSSGGEAPGVSPSRVVLAALPQVRAAEAATPQAAPPLGIGVSEAEFAARKMAANLQSELSRSGSTAAPRAAGSHAVEVPPATGFRALGYGCAATHFVPPDQGLAVNQSWVFEMVNACVAVYDKAGNLQAGFPKTLDAFFGLGASSFTYDPRAIYDWANNRFIAIATMSGSTIRPRILVAVSQTSNPLGGWNIYRFVGPAGTDVGELSDFPQLGQDRSAVYVSFNRFSAGLSFVDARLMIIPKSKLYAGLSTGYFWFYNFNVGGVTFDTIQPANEFSPSDHPRAEFLLNSYNIRFGGGQCSTSVCNGLIVWAVSNPLAAQPEATGIIIGTENNYSLPPDASQPGCTACIITNDVRISGGVTYHAGSLFASLNTASESAAGAHVLWFELQPVLNDNGSSCGTSNLCPDIVGARMLNEDCYECGSDGDWYYATLQPDLENNVTMVFHYSDSSDAPSIVYTSRRAAYTANLMHDAGQYLVAPMASYALSPRRWGDYTATAPDLSANGSNVWFAGEFSNDAGAWKTAIGHNSFNSIAYP